MTDPTKTPATRARALAGSLTWCLTPEALQAVLAFLSREDFDPAAVASERGEKLKYTRSVEVRLGVAIIPIQGVIARRANLFSEFSGATSIDVLAQDLNVALNDQNIKAVLLNIDSPGGEANGIHEMANMVYAARSKKPVVAYVGGSACSAAYFLAAAASEIVCDAMAILGSIGTVVTLYQPMDGEEDIVSSQSPNKRPDIRTDEGKAKVRETLDAMTDVFLASVGLFRGLTTEEVVTAGDSGGIRVGASAVEHRLADRLGTFEGVLAELAAGAPQQTAQALKQQANAARVAVAEATFQTATVKAASAAATYQAAITQASAAAALALGTNRAPTARLDTTPKTKQETPMSDQDPTTVSVPEPPMAPVLSTISANDPAVQAQINQLTQQMAAEMEQQRQLILEQAQAQFQRQMAEMQAKQKIENYAQHVTTPTFQRPHALPFTAEQVSSFLVSLGSDQRTAAQGLFDKLLQSGFVDFDEYGTTGDGEAKASAKERWDAAITAKTAKGMAQSAAIAAVMREQPQLREELNASGGR